MISTECWPHYIDSIEAAAVSNSTHSRPNTDHTIKESSSKNSTAGTVKGRTN